MSEDFINTDGEFISEDDAAKQQEKLNRLRFYYEALFAAGFFEEYFVNQTIKKQAVNSLSHTKGWIEQVKGFRLTAHEKGGDVFVGLKERGDNLNLFIWQAYTYDKPKFKIYLGKIPTEILNMGAGFKDAILQFCDEERNLKIS